MTNEEPKKYNNRDKQSEFYELRASDQEELEKIRERVVDFCKKNNLPTVFLVQHCNTAERFGVIGFNFSGGERTANAFYALSLLTKWMQSHTKADLKKFQKVEALIRILDNEDGEVNPMAFLMAMLSTDAKDASDEEG